MSKTYERMVAEEQAAAAKYEAETEYKGFMIAELRRVMGAVQNPAGWKKEWAAYVPHRIVRAVLVAVELFHGDRAEVAGVQPVTGKVLVRGRGYQC